MVTGWLAVTVLAVTGCRLRTGGYGLSVTDGRLRTGGSGLIGSYGTGGYGTGGYGSGGYGTGGYRLAVTASAVTGLQQLLRQPVTTRNGGHGTVGYIPVTTRDGGCGADVAAGGYGQVVAVGEGPCTTRAQLCPNTAIPNRSGA